MSKLEDELLLQIRALKLPEPVVQYRFHPIRRWKFDIAWPDLMLAVEVEGGGWIGGRHTRGSGFTKDLEKYDSAMQLGWSIYRCDGALIKSGKAVKTIEILMEMKNA